MLVDGVAAMWANTSTDTDFVAAPIPNGLETFTTLRSPAAPETIRLAVTSPTGGLALADGADGEVIVRRDGIAIGRVPRPWAKDAQGTDVPVTMTVDGDDLVLRVAHQDADLAYPILVDPIYKDWFNGGRRWDSGSTAGLRDGTWQYMENPAGWYPHDTRCIASLNCKGSSDGFYIYTYGG